MTANSALLWGLEVLFKNHCLCENPLTSIYYSKAQTHENWKEKPKGLTEEVLLVSSHFFSFFFFFLFSQCTMHSSLEEDWHGWFFSAVECSVAEYQDDIIFEKC